MQLEQILKEWEADSKVDTKALDESSAKTPLLHSKYLSLYSNAKLRLKKRMMDYDDLKKKKWLWFNAKLTKQEMDELGWQYDPFNGMTRPLKGDMEMWYANDPDLKKINSVIEYSKVLVETLEEILNNLRWRHQTVKNIIDWRRFEAGN